MEKIRDGKSGELTAEIFETWYPNNPEEILKSFLDTGMERMVCVHKLNDTDIVVSHITIEYAHILLNEFKVLRGEMA